jgi:hypothetical protein
MTLHPRTPLPRPPAHVEPYVRILGLDGAIEFLLAFGGSERHIARDPRLRSDIEAVIGADGAAALAEAAMALPRRHPLAKPWMAQVFHARGLSVNEIARKVRVSNVSVRSYLETDRQKRLPPPQPDLFDT